MLSRDQILAAEDSKATTVNVPEWGGDVCVRVMGGRERDQWELATFRDGSMNRDNFRASLLAHTLCDDKGALLFSASDVIALGAKSGNVLAKLAQVALKLNGLTDDDVNDLAKN